MTLELIIFFLFIPILYPEFSFNIIISFSVDGSNIPVFIPSFVFISTISPIFILFIFIILYINLPSYKITIMFKYL